MDVTRTNYTEHCVNASQQLDPPSTHWSNLSLPEQMKYWAIKYAEYKWCVLQVYGLRSDLTCCCAKSKGCSSPGKHPIEMGWQKNPINNVEVVKGWQWKDRNVGIVTGPCSNLYVIDQDEKDDGPTTLKDWENKNEEIFPEFIVLTGGGGYHYYLPYPETCMKGTDKKPLGKGVDVKADNGFVVAPPSRHYLGKTYEWEV